MGDDDGICSDYKVPHFNHILVHLIGNYYFLIK